MLTIPKSYYLAFKKVQNLEEYFEGRLDFGSHAELSNLLEQILIVTLHNSDSNSVQWQTAQLYDEKKPPELPTVHINFKKMRFFFFLVFAKLSNASLIHFSYFLKLAAFYLLWKVVKTC